MTGPQAAGAPGATAATSPTSGQVPASAPSSSNTLTPAAGQVPGEPQDDLTPAQLRDALAKARREAAEHRVKLNEYETQRRAAEESNLSELQKAQKRLAELERAKADSERSTQERIVRAEVKAAATNVGIKPELAARLIDYAEIEFTDDGEPKNLDKLLKKLVETYPELVVQQQAPASQNGYSYGNGQQQPPRPPASSGGATNPGRSAGNGGLTLEIIQRMPMRERMARIEEIKAWELAQRQTR